MYCDFYQLDEKPFNVTPDPKFLYLNDRYREALATLHYGIAERKGFVTLIGEAGTGKTTLLNKLLDQLDADTRTVFLFNTNVTFDDILEYIFAEFDLPVHSGKRLYMLQRLNAFLLDELRAGRNVALLIDEAQDLDVSVLEDLRLLSNLETAKEKILQIVLAGQPELAEKLGDPALRQLRQRIAVHCRLYPLSRSEVAEYIQCRLAAAGCADRGIFTPEAEEEIWRFSRGIPRLVNVICDNALVIGYALGKKRIDAAIAREAAADLLEAREGAESERDDKKEETGAAESVRGGRRATWVVFAVVALALVVGFFSMGRTRKPVTSEDASPPRPLGDAVIRPGQELLASGGPVSATGVPSEEPGHVPMPEEKSALVLRREVPEEVAPESLAVSPERTGAEKAASDAAPAPAAREPVPPVEGERSETRVPVARGSLGGSESSNGGSGGGTVRGLPEAEGARSASAEQPEGASAEIPSLPAAPIPEPRAKPPEPEREVPARRASESAGLRLAERRFEEVVARAGNSLGKIAARKYGRASYTILDLVKLANPEVEDVDRIAEGQVLALPELSGRFPLVEDSSGRLRLLVFSTPSAQQASSVVDVLRAYGFEAERTPGSLGRGKPIYRVLVGGVGDAANASEISERIRRVVRQDEQLARLGEG
ncbi:MAG: hypothetical protein KatS3mg076_0468 [Candidatus Binatia bacterium]|nr:MAG: hypothetical protein KatS3mg076_0468 [Candidatus Binatia bacterium]